MKYGILQVKEDKMRDFAFESFEQAEKYNGVGSVVKDNYDEVYEFDMESSTEIHLDDIYEIFNLNRPSDFKGHSLSVSDVVRFDDKYFYCDSFGWKELDWGKEK